MHYHGQSQSLTRNEQKRLHLLLERQGQVVSREDCLEALWDQHADGERDPGCWLLTRRAYVRALVADW